MKILVLEGLNICIFIKGLVNGLGQKFENSQFFIFFLQIRIEKDLRKMQNF